MAKATTRRLKVFQAQFGFYDSIVAVPSQAAALAAWGTHQNLFASGDARQAVDEAAIASALENPGVPLRRPVGVGGRFEVEPTALPKPPAEPASPKQRSAAEQRVASRPPPDRGALDRAEAELDRIEASWKQHQADIARRRKALDAEEATARRLHAARRKTAQAAVRSALEAFVRAGGKAQPSRPGDSAA